MCVKSGVEASRPLKKDLRVFRVFIVVRERDDESAEEGRVVWRSLVVVKKSSNYY